MDKSKWDQSSDSVNSATIDSARSYLICRMLSSRRSAGKSESAKIRSGSSLINVLKISPWSDTSATISKSPYLDEISAKP